MAKQPELSIIIPAHNCGDKISQIVDSILKQSFANFELIIVNDKSSDDTKQVIQKLAKSDERIILINQKHNGGAAVARNAGLSIASGKYIMFFDADDNIVPQTITEFVKAIKDTESDLVVSGFRVVTSRNNLPLQSVDVCTNNLPEQLIGESWRLYILRLLGLDGRLYQVWNKIYKASVIKKYKLEFKPGINFGEDLIFNLDYLSHINKISFINKPLYIYYQSLDSGTFSKSSLIYANRLQNYNYLTNNFLKDEPASKEKESLLIWIKYSWLYSHLLAISLSMMSQEDKLRVLKEVSNMETSLSLSDKEIIGSKRYHVELLVRYLIKHPRLAQVIMSTSNRLKNSKYTAKLWQTMRRKING